MEAKVIEAETTDVEKFDERHPAMQREPDSALMVAMQKGYEPAFIEKMMELQERHEANEARKAYVVAMAAFKANPPEILKTNHVSYQNKQNQTVEWDHAVLGEIADAVIKTMSPCGLYHRWDMEQPDKDTVKTTCIITHELGHSEQTSMQGPPDTSGGKDTLKAVASTNTLLQRLTLLALTGLAAKGMDNEGGNMDPVEYITEKQLSQIVDMANESGTDAGKFLKYMGVKSLEAIPAAQFDKAMKALGDKLKAKQAKDKADAGDN